MTQSQATEPLVRFGRRQSRGVLLGFTGPRLLAMSVAVAVLVLAMFTLGAIGLAVTSPVCIGLLALAFVRWNGFPVADSIPVAAHWGARQAAGQVQYRAQVTTPRPAGTLALPGDAAALRFHVHDASGAVMVHDPHRRTLSAVLRVSHPAYVLLSADDQARRVAAWSRVLASLAATGSCAGVQILETTVPDPGNGVLDWYSNNGVHDGSWAAQQYQELVQTAAPRSYVHRTLITLSLDMRKATRQIREVGRGIGAAAEVLRGDMATCMSSLRAADLNVHTWLGAEELAHVIRQAYDPNVDQSPFATHLQLAGPVALDEHWDYLRHDSAYSAVLWISEWPRIDVAPHFLHSLVFLQDVRKSISIVAKPLSTGDALRSIRKEKVEYLTDAQQNARIGKISDFSAEQEYADVLARERALVSGHADLRFSGFISVTAHSRDTLNAATASAERAATQCGCETRLLYGQQAQGFTVATLPLGRMVN